MISFREYFTLYEAANPHNLATGDRVTLKIGGQDVEFQVRDKQSSTSSTPKPADAGEGYGYYLNLEPIQNYGDLENIAPQTKDSQPMTQYNIGTVHNIPLDVIKQMVDSEQGSYKHKSEISGSTATQANSTANSAKQPGQPGYGEGGTGGAQSNDQLTAGRQLAYDTINRASAEKSAKSALGAKIGQGIDDVARRMVPDQKKEVRGASVYAKDGPGGVAHQQIVPTGDARYDAKRQKELTNRIS